MSNLLFRLGLIAVLLALALSRAHADCRLIDPDDLRLLGPDLAYLEPGVWVPAGDVVSSDDGVHLWFCRGAW